ncbi:MAG: cytochrome c [Rhodobacteraceae bacterium]|mgnify:FL=1|jgi:mono/diheme cytochrome c family protein|uniref:c-type cytochrome n=1 Tax=uncultured Hyphomonas sp. TaxID=225298 RepID=UPI001D4B5032|nr:cytochrome c [uncultured Hyphomonas sp.]MBR9763583.1 cytochrome c [Paracoccaceae bacterium]MBR9823449.1 cytochrome c [Paracoccaceae bacterium]
MNKTLLAIAAFLLIGGFAVYWNATQSVQESAGHSMVPPDTSEIAEGATIVEVSLPAELSSEAQIGQRVYEAKCAECHGANAAGQNGVAPPLVHKIYEPSHHSDMAFVLAAKNGVRAHHWNFGNMPPVEGLTDADVKMIARYVRELQAENGIF